MKTKVTKVVKAVKKAVKKVKAVATQDYTTYDIREREAMFLADLAQLNIKYGVGLSIATIDLNTRDLPVIKA